MATTLALIHIIITYSGLCFHTCPPNINSQHRGQNDPFIKGILAILLLKTLCTTMQYHSTQRRSPYNGPQALLS